MKRRLPGGWAACWQSEREPAHVAQLVEHFLGKEEVSGSNPLVGSRQFKEEC